MTSGPKLRWPCHGLQESRQDDQIANDGQVYENGQEPPMLASPRGLDSALAQN